MDQANTSASGGSNAQDFQPPTQNPQGNVGGGLQPSSATNNNIFNQPGANQQALPQINSLRVLSQGSRNSPTSTPTGSTSEGFSFGILLFVLILIAIASGVFLLRAKRTKPVPAPIETADKHLTDQPSISTKLKKKKKPKKKIKNKK